MLALDRLAFRYAAAARPALDGISLRAQRGEVLGLLGPNGAGKTTLISLLAGLLTVQHGEILVDGEPLALVRKRHPTRIAIAPQEYAFYPMLTVRENLCCFAGSARLTGARLGDRVRAGLAFAQLERFADVRAERLSGGLKRRLNLAIALLAEPELVLFDEPTVGVDPQSRAFVLESIRSLASQGVAVIYASHYMEEIEAIAERVAILDHGRVLRDGTLDELLSEGAAHLAITLESGGVEQARALLSRFGELLDGDAPLRLRLAEAQRVAPVFAALEAAGLRVRHAQFGRCDLEQLFMSLTHRSLREA
ncbi:ABC transporter ATP-binding protein [Schlegelella sp. S2-27]|uniref:ABC transporter ATP-binding protein n=1 Tax=Caldimonas mangrovi TaxID=2944811 RepID=A0ABT0YMR2_9BURK|nr:ABC transporter ATP-binding protein [Caldimonas mangrovi]MCM5679173.1 ABC transporter ATP-binding protein [Caldimonas mangrovi]